MFSGKYSSISSLPCVKINEKPPGITQLRRRQGYRSVNKCLSDKTHKPPKTQLHGQPDMLSDLSARGNRILKHPKRHFSSARQEIVC